MCEINWDGSTIQPVEYYEPAPQEPESCDNLIATAIKNGQWLYELTNQVYFSPTALRRLQKEGKFRWSPYNFTAFDPARLKSDKFFEHFSGYSK